MKKLLLVVVMLACSSVFGAPPAILEHGPEGALVLVTNNVQYGFSTNYVYWVLSPSNGVVNPACWERSDGFWLWDTARGLHFFRQYGQGGCGTNIELVILQSAPMRDVVIHRGDLK